MKQDNKISAKTIEILEAEGLGGALNVVGEVLALHGLRKHGAQAWKQLPYHTLFEKAVRHISTNGIDSGSKRPHTANGSIRTLMLLSRELYTLGNE